MSNKVQQKNRDALRNSEISEANDKSQYLNRLERILYVAMGYSIIHVFKFIQAQSDGFFDLVSSTANMLIYEYIIYCCFHAWTKGQVKETQKPAVLFSGIFSMGVMTWGVLAEGGAIGGQGYTQWMLPLAGIIGIILMMWIFSTDPVKTAEMKRKAGAAMLQIQRKLDRIRRATAELKAVRLKRDIEFKDINMTLEQIERKALHSRSSRRKRKKRAEEAASRLLEGNNDKFLKLIPERSQLGGDGVGESNTLPNLKVNPTRKK